MEALAKTVKLFPTLQENAQETSAVQRMLQSDLSEILALHSSLSWHAITGNLPRIRAKEGLTHHRKTFYFQQQAEMPSD